MCAHLDNILKSDRVMLLDVFFSVFLMEITAI